ncbi:hypothetical protein SKAU_G00353430 [Synaphobranchus kaupii]|uniref:Uncharacterized protein n=1 Tax=Synaphobranchus kaupii TaxID=118154 RepID=A0A9Q1IHG2_SYNKA|nr:hypothetical protein SKAU_G00353430 [Synaphobranchus kaupii]
MVYCRNPSQPFHNIRDSSMHRSLYGMKDRLRLRRFKKRSWEKTEAKNGVRRTGSVLQYSLRVDFLTSPIRRVMARNEYTSFKHVERNILKQFTAVGVSRGFWTPEIELSPRGSEVDGSPPVTGPHLLNWHRTFRAATGDYRWTVLRVFLHIVISLPELRVPLKGN